MNIFRFLNINICVINIIIFIRIQSINIFIIILLGAPDTVTIGN
jgi:hypothetical protein